jgi:Uma2 family endonuclease
VNWVKLPNNSCEFVSIRAYNNFIMLETVDAVLESAEMAQHEPIVLRTAPVLRMTDNQLLRLCALNKELQIERDAEGNLIVMLPESFNSGRGGTELIGIIHAWAKRDKRGQVLGSSTGFILPNDAMRAPDVSWVRNEKVKKLSKKDRAGFPHLVPDFVVEILSPSDTRRRVMAKMEEYIANGVQLGWMIDPRRRQVHVYRPRRAPEVLDDPEWISGEPVLTGFKLHLPDLWAEMFPEDES